MTLAILVTGAREYSNKKLVRNTLKNAVEDHEKIILIHGGCSGADKLAGEVGLKLGFIVEVYPAEWKKYGKSAGPKRNKQMVDRLVEYKNLGYNIKMFAFHDDIDNSKGTKNCVNIAQKNGIAVDIIVSNADDVNNVNNVNEIHNSCNA